MHSLSKNIHTAYGLKNNDIYPISIDFTRLNQTSNQIHLIGLLNIFNPVLILDIDFDTVNTECLLIPNSRLFKQHNLAVSIHDNEKNAYES